jgi:hypothetical protein
MVHTMFHIQRKPELNDSTIKSERRSGQPDRRRSGKQAQLCDVSAREPFVDPVHGRHCICARCLLHRAA